MECRLVLAQEYEVSEFDLLSVFYTIWRNTLEKRLLRCIDHRFEESADGNAPRVAWLLMKLIVLRIVNLQAVDENSLVT